MAASPLTSLAEVRALARLKIIPKSPVPALYWDGAFLTQYAIDIGSNILLGAVEFGGGQWTALSCEPDPQALNGRRWRILGSFTRSDLARSALEADVAGRCGLSN